MIRSMTGYGKAEAGLKNGKLTIEIRTLNGKTADINLKSQLLPRDRELEVRSRIASRLVRGTIDVYLGWEADSSESARRINADLARAYVKDVSPLAAEMGVGPGITSESVIAQAILLGSVLRIPDLLEAKKAEVIGEDEWESVEAALDDCLDMVDGYRRREGEALYADVTSRVSKILALYDGVESHEKERADAVRQRILDAAGELGVKLDTERFEQEMIFYLEKYDINEEKVRLEALDPSAYGNVEGLNLEAGTYISVIGKASGGDFWDKVKEGAEKAVSDINEALGYKGEDRVRMVYSGPSEAGDVDEQVNILDEELARYPQAVGISIIDSQSGDVQFDLAAENGISVVTYDSLSNYQNVMAKISTDNDVAGAEAADHLAETMGDTGEVLIFAHDSRSLTTQERVDGFAQKMQADHPGITVGNTYYLDELEELKQTIADEINGGTYAREGQEAAPIEDEGNRVAAEDISDEEAMDYIFAKNPDATAIYGTSGEAVMAAVENTQRLEKEDMSIVGFDATEEEAQALEDGLVEGLIAQNPYGMGYATVVACSRAILEIGNEAEVDSGYIWITADNMEDPEVAAMLY